MPLTDRQLEVYQYLRDYLSERGFPPTLREISKHFGWSSTNSASCHLQALAAKHCIEVDPGKSRAIRILTIGERHGESEESQGKEEVHQEACA